MDRSHFIIVFNAFSNRSVYNHEPKASDYTFNATRRRNQCCEHLVNGIKSYAN